MSFRERRRAILSNGTRFRAPTGEFSCGCFVPVFRRGTADADGSMPNETPGSAESRFLGRRHGAMHTAEIDAAPSSEGQVCASPATKSTKNLK
jgi:hypothetical protein